MHRLVAAAAALVLSSTLAHAHPGGPAHDLVQGFLHPLSGLDHVLAMVTVGLLAFQLGGRALWLVPSAFVVMMAVSAIAGAAGVAPPRVELGVAASLLVLGAAVALRLGVPSTVATVVVGAFAVFHGAAHGAEMPHTVAGLGYGFGFLAATALLHAIGIGAGVLKDRIGQTAGTYALRGAGAVTAMIGATMIASGL